MAPGCAAAAGSRSATQVKFACVDGPDFDGHKVDFNDLMMRLKRYAEEEKAALDRWSENCRMTKQAPSVSKGVKRRFGMRVPDPFDEALGG